MLKKSRNILLLFFQIIIFVYFLILVFLYFYQRNLLYHPNENNYSGDQISVPIEKVKIKFFINVDDIKSLYTGDELSFLWDRTVSRLEEMQNFNHK